MNNKYYIFIFILFSIAFSISMPSLATPMISEGDAYIRANIARQIMDASYMKTLINGGIWLPGHFVILTLSYMIHNSPLSPRIITLFFSIFSIIPLYVLTHELFSFEPERKKILIAFYTIILYIVLPIRYVLSTVTLSEPVFVFFLLCSVSLLISQKKPHIYWGIVMLNIAHSMRFESWFIIPFILLLILCSSYSSKDKVLLSVSTLVFPLLWFCISFLYHGNVLAFVAEKISLAHRWGSLSTTYNFFTISFLLLQRFFADASAVIFIFILLGYVMYGNMIIHQSAVHKRKIMIIYLSIPLYLMYLLYMQVFLGSMEWFPHRYVYIPLILLLPFAGFYIARLYEGIMYKVRKFTVFICLICTILMLIQIVSQIRTLQYSSNPIRDIRSDLVLSEIYPLTLLPTLKSCHSKRIFYISAEEPRFYTESVFEYLLPLCDIHRYTDMQAALEEVNNTISESALILEKSNKTMQTVMQTTIFHTEHKTEHFYLLRKK